MKIYRRKKNNDDDYEEIAAGRDDDDGDEGNDGLQKPSHKTHVNIIGK